MQDTGEIFIRATVQLRITVGGLHPYYTYNFSISAVTVVPGPYSEPIVVQTLPASESECQTVFDIIIFCLSANHHALFII